MPTDKPGHNENVALTWAQVFPHAVNAPGARDHVDNSSPNTWQQIAMTAAATARVDDHVALEEHFPFIRNDPADVASLRLDGRTLDALSRKDIRTIADVGRRCARDLAQILDKGTPAVRSITNKLAWRNAERALGIAVGSDPPARVNARDESAGVLDADSTDALRVVAGWHVLRGQPESSLWSDAGLDGAPARILYAWSQLQDLRAENVLGADAPSPAAVLDELLSRESPRNVEVLSRRLFADEPETLDSIGSDLNVTRERVRQIARNSSSNLQSEVTSHQEGLADLGAALRQRIGVVSSLDRVLEVYPSLEECVSTVQQPAWRVIDRLDESFEIRDGWAAVPTVSDAAQRTQEAVRECLDELGTAPVANVAGALGIDLATRVEEFGQWLNFLDIPCFRDRIVAKANSIPDWAVVILACESRPLTAEEIGEFLPNARSESSIRNALATDERITRVDRRAFALASWGMESYAGIRELIGRHLDAHGGSGNLEEMVVDLTARFDVAERSVRAYASAFPYETHQGRVTWREPETQAKQGNLGAARCVYATPEGVAFRFEVTSDHWRGSGSVLPSDLARCVGLHEGQSLRLSSAVGEQTIYWTGIQPSLGSVKRLVEDLEAEPGSWVMATFGTVGDFRLRRLELSGQSGVALAQTMTGTDNLPAADARAGIAEALSLPADSGWPSIIAAAGDRGEDDLASALLRDPDVGASNDTGDRPPGRGESSVTSDDILDLL